MLKLTWPRAAAWRIRRQHLDQRAPAGSMLAVASRLGGLHAQVMSCAELTVWARVDNLDRRAVQRALWEDRSSRRGPCGAHCTCFPPTSYPCGTRLSAPVAGI